MKNNIKYQELSDDQLSLVGGGASVNVHQAATIWLDQHATAKGFVAVAVNVGVAVPINVNAPVDVKVNIPTVDLPFIH